MKISIKPKTKRDVNFSTSKTENSYPPSQELL